MAILEAMAAGVAVISTPVGAIPDAIVDGLTGLIVRPGDVPALSHTICKLIQDRGLRQRLAVNARTRFERMFTIDGTADGVAALYSRMGLGQGEPDHAVRPSAGLHWSWIANRAPGD
jgi:glycosyltransferase involved in cell wall biosynthesis